MGKVPALQVLRLEFRSPGPISMLSRCVICNPSIPDAEIGDSAEKAA